MFMRSLQPGHIAAQRHVPSTYTTRDLSLCPDNYLINKSIELTVYLAPCGRTLLISDVPDASPTASSPPPGLPVLAVSWPLPQPHPLQLLEGSLGTDHTARA